MRHDPINDIEQALGPVAVMSLEQRGLLSPVTIPDAATPLDGARAQGALVGVAVGRALASAVARAHRRRPGAVIDPARLRLSPATGRSGSEAQTAALSAELWAREAWQAAPLLSDRIAGMVGQLHAPGSAIVATADRRRDGVPWFEAGVASFGNAALPRAVAVGVVHAGAPARAAMAAQLDAAVTHAHPIATSASAITAALVAALVARPADAAVADVVDAVLSAVSAGQGPVADLAGWLQTAVGVDPAPHPDADLAAALARFGTQPMAQVSLAIGVWVARQGPATALAHLVTAPHVGRTHAAVLGGLLGAAHGVDAFPARWTEGVEHGDLLRSAAALAAASGRPSPGGQPTAASNEPGQATIWFLLDRSGSMAAIANDVVGGFDQFFAEQAALPGEAQVTVVQFDNEQPHEVLVDARPIGDVPSLRGRFVPRGTTPLFDALGLLLDRAERAGGHDADQLVVVLTDGEENASRHWDRARLFDRIARLQQRGWTFVFLGANQDSYAAGARIGLSDGNVSNFAPDGFGVRAASAGLSRATREWRGKGRAERSRDREQFWGDRKEAEDDLRERHRR
jgi:ADP-ribosylglycohydrolase